MPTNNTDAEAEVPERDTLILADQSLARGFIQLPKLVLHARNLSRDAKLLYAILLGYAWQEERCFPGYQRLCRDMQASENAVRKYMRELEAVKLLHQKRRGLGKTNVYTLTDLRTSKIEVQEPPDYAGQEPRKTAVPEPAKSEAYKETVEVETRSSKNTHATLPDNPIKANSNIRKGLRPVLTGEESGSPTGNQPIWEGRSLNRSVRTQVAESPPTPTRADGMARISEVLAAAGIAVKRARVDERMHAEPERLKAPAPPLTPAEEAPPERIDLVVEDISTKLRDTEHLTSNITQARRLWQSSGQSVEDFVVLLYEVRETVRWKANVGNRMPYFFKCVKVALGLEPNPNPVPQQRQRKHAPDEPAQHKSLAGQYAHLVRR